MKHLLMTMSVVLAMAACTGNEATVPAIPTPPVLNEESCYNLNLNVYKIEQTKKLTGQYGEGEEERLADLGIAAALMGCYLDPEFEPKLEP